MKKYQGELKTIVKVRKTAYYFAVSNTLASNAGKNRRKKA